MVAALKWEDRIELNRTATERGFIWKIEVVSGRPLLNPGPLFIIWVSEKWALNVCASLSAGKRNIIIIIWLISPHFPWDLFFCWRATESKEYWPDYSTAFALMLFLHRGSPALLSGVGFFVCFNPLWQRLLGATHGLTLKCSPSQTRITSSHSSSRWTKAEFTGAHVRQRLTCLCLWSQNRIHEEKSLCPCVFIPGVSAVNRWWNISTPARMW